MRYLPSQSRLALYFVQHAKTFELFADVDEPAIWANGNMRQLTRDVEELLGEGEELVNNWRQRESEREDQRKREDAWRRSPIERRETLLFQVLGDEQLTIAELLSRLNLELDGAAKRDATLFIGNVRSLVMRMMRDGQLDRVADPFQGGVRYRYFKRREGGE